MTVRDRTGEPVEPVQPTLDGDEPDDEDGTVADRSTADRWLAEARAALQPKANR